MMRRRLFWKILIGFWATIFLMVETLWLLIALYGTPRRPELMFASRAAPALVASAAEALETGGRPRLDALLARWPDEQRAYLVVTPAAGPAGPEGVIETPELPGQNEELVAGASLVLAQQRVTAADGLAWEVSYRYVQRPRRHPGPLEIPHEIVILGAVAGLIFSSVLAWYLTRPINRLRRGFERFAQGELKVRLQPEMGRRRDEIADLARDFDAMASRIQQLMAARDQLLHDVSHELRSPLARLHMAVGLARQDPRKMDVSLGRIEMEARRLDEMVGELLTLSRVESGAPSLDGYFDLHGLLRSIIADARYEGQAATVAVSTNIDENEEAEPGPTIKGSPDLMRRALENIVRNALRFSPAGKAVEVRVSGNAVTGQQVVRVADDGPGVPEEALATMFDPFVRVAGAVPGPGFGLGLAIARRTVEAHGGSVVAANRPQGGLEVTVTLPSAAS